MVETVYIALFREKGQAWRNEMVAVGLLSIGSHFAAVVAVITGGASVFE